MTITYQGTTVAEDGGTSRSGVSALRSRAEGNVQESPGVDLSMPLIEGRGNRKRVVTFAAKMQFEDEAAALAHWEAVSEFPGTAGELVIGETTHWAGCRAADSEPIGVSVKTSYEFVIGQDVEPEEEA